METALTERRRHPRVPMEATSWRELRLRTGDQLLIVDIAAGGALVESPRRLLPGTAVFAQLISPTALHAVRAVVVRCHVHALSGHEGLVYRGALAFASDVCVDSTHSIDDPMTDLRVPF
jgi:hypothetical protein